MPEQVTLRDYFDAQIGRVEEATKARLNSIEGGIEIASKEMDRRLESMNEFRAQLSHQATLFVTREESESKLIATEARLEGRICLIEQQVTAATKGKISWGVALAITVLSSGLVAMLAVVLR